MYYANFITNNFTRKEKPIIGTNLRKLIKDIRKIAEGNTTFNGYCRWYVENENGEEIASGGLNHRKRFRII